MKEAEQSLDAIIKEAEQYQNENLGKPYTHNIMRLYVRQIYKEYGERAAKDAARLLGV